MAKDTLIIQTNNNESISAKIVAENDSVFLRSPSSNATYAEYKKKSDGTYSWTVNSALQNEWNRLSSDGGVSSLADFSSQLLGGEIGRFSSNTNTSIDDYLNATLDDATLDNYIKNGFGYGSDLNGTNARSNQQTVATQNPDDDNLDSKESSIDSLNDSVKDDGGSNKPAESLPKLIKYPADMSKDMDKLKITIKEYKPANIDSSTFDVNSADRNSGKIFSTIFLPIPGGISDQNQVSWGKGDMNAMEIAMADFALSTIGAAAGDGNVVESAKQSAQRIANKITSGAGEGATAIANILAGAATGIGNQQLLQRVGGRIINPNAELLFNGPSLRQFGFSFVLSARSEGESKAIKSLIKALKVGMAVRKSKTGLFLLSPHLFELSYVTGEGESTSLNDNLNKFKLCALTGMQVNYTPNGTYMTYADKSPTSYGLDLQFQEIEPIYAGDYKKEDTIGY